ncbi:MAG: LysR family transcriptional regulator [Mangrovicoccus sp.]
MDLARRLKPTQLRLLVKIAESGKLQIAASALNISQPAASRSLSDIEATFETPLFQRLPKGMVPTLIGDAVLRHARSILNAFDNLDSEVEGLKLGQGGEIRVGSVTGPAVKCLVPAILKMKETAPDIEPTFEVGPSVELVRGLEEGRFDFILARLPYGYDSRAFHIQPAQWEVVSLVVHHSHPLAGHDAVRLQDLTRYDWVVQERGSPIREAMENAFTEAGAHPPSKVINSSSLLVMLSLLERSHTIAPLSEEVGALLTRQTVAAELTLLNLDRVIQVSPYFIIRNRSQQLSRAAERLLKEVLLRL